MAIRVGVYVDAENISRNGGRGLRYGTLLEFAIRGGAEPVRLNTYVAFDPARAEADRKYRARTTEFHSVLRDFGFKVIQKEVRWYCDEEGQRYAKANADLDMAVDALLQSDRLDRVVLVTGDGDFVQVVRALQNKGCRVEVVAFDHVSTALRQEADVYLSGFLVPNLLPCSTSSTDKSWGEVGSRVRGQCHSFCHDARYGFLRYLHTLSADLWQTDTRQEQSPYRSAFFRATDLPRDIDVAALPNRDHIFEFALTLGEKGLVARDMCLLNSRNGNGRTAPSVR